MARKESDKRVTEAEWWVMGILWEDHPLTAAEVAELIADAPFVTDVLSIRTYLSRLVKKGFVNADKSSKEHSYSPAIGRQTYLREEAKRLKAQLPPDTAKALLIHLLDDQSIGASDLDRIESKIQSLRKIDEEKG